MQGVAGFPGFPGFKGSAGIPGIYGIKGPPGLAGLRGDTGPKVKYFYSLSLLGMLKNWKMSYFVYVCIFLESLKKIHFCKTKVSEEKKSEDLTECAERDYSHQHVWVLNRETDNVYTAAEDTAEA